MPTGYTPIYKISRNGEDITSKFNDRCVMLRVDYSSADGDDDRFAVSLDDRDWLIARPSLGETLSIELGYAEVGLAFMGDFTIEKAVFSGAPKLITLTGTASGAHKLMRAPMTENYDNKTLGEIVADFAGKAGLEAIVNPQLADQKIPFRNVIMSPYQALQELGRTYNFVGKVAGGKLIVTPRGGSQSASGQELKTLVLGPAHFGTWSVEHTERDGFGSVKAAYRDKDKNLRSFVEEKSPIAGDAGLAPFIPNRLFNSLPEAQAAAKAQMSAILRSRGNADIVLAKGDPWIKDQQRLLIRGMRDGVDGSYVTELASHTYAPEQGIGTAIKAKPSEDGASFETIYQQASEAQKRAGFLVPDVGGLMGEALGGCRHHSISSFADSLRRNDMAYDQAL